MQVHDSLVTAAFSGLFLLKMANLFPGELDLNTIAVQVEQLASLLSEVAAERYALTLRLMLANLRRKVGMSSGGVTPMSGDMMSAAPPFLDPSLVTVPPVPPPFTMEELGVPWPHSQAIFSPSSIPVWLQDQNLTDLGLPVNGSDGIFLQMSNSNGWSGDFPPMPEAW
ncbi:hypothetical protein QCA50_004219 [Cerrena zonata]|uniref:Uncharacterized protein n=1 Tax=Cerrena zonata TaxID=2478898 RepID=A0AAW0GSU4_9APHY